MAETGSRRLIILFIIILVIIAIIVLIFTLIYKTESVTSPTVTGCANLPPPSSVEAISTGVTKIKVSWSPVPDAARYRVYIGSIPGFTRGTAFDDYLTGDTEYIIERQVLGRTYYIRVESINICDNAGELSEELSVELGFPEKFRIVSREQPSLALKIAPDFTNIIVDTLCTGVGLDDLCVWNYDQTEGFITGVSSSNTCIKTYPASVDLRVKYEPCGTISYYNWNAARRWNYNSENGTICNPSNAEGLNCIKINGPAIPGQSTIRVPYDGTPSMQWDIVEA